MLFIKIMKNNDDGFELLDLENDFIVLDYNITNQHVDEITNVNKRDDTITIDNYVSLQHKIKIIDTQMRKLLIKLEKSSNKIDMNKHELWLNATNSVIKCIANVIEKGNSLVIDNNE